MVSSSSLPKSAVIVAIAVAVVVAVSQWEAVRAEDRDVLTYHGGPLLTGNVQLSVLYYGQLGRVHKKQIRGFLKSLNSLKVEEQPSVAQWWNMVESFQSMANPALRTNPEITVRVGSTITDTSYSAGKIMTMDFIKILVQKATQGKPNTLALIFTDRQVTVQDMCTGRCSQHGVIDGQPYVLVGNPETECPESCAWPFAKSSSGPGGVILQPPSGNLGADAMVMALASGLADAVTSPNGDGIFMPGPRHAGPLGPGTACKDIFGSGAVPGFPGKVRVDPKSGGSFNFHGVKGKKFLLPAIWNPATSDCWTPL